MRMAFSCVTGIHPRRLRYIDPNAANETRWHFWRNWRALAREHGWKLTRMFNFEYAPLEAGPGGPWPAKDDELWIAGVPSFICRGEAHAVVMCGQQLHFDSSDSPRRRRPTRIDSGFRVTRFRG